MFALLIVALTLITQSYIFRDTPSHPANPCAADVSACPEEALDSIFARQKEEMERFRRLALCPPKTDDSGRMAARAAGQAPDKVDSVRLETCLAPE